MNLRFSLRLPHIYQMKVKWEWWLFLSPFKCPLHPCTRHQKTIMTIWEMRNHHALIWVTSSTATERVGGGGGGRGEAAVQNWEAELGSHWSSRTMEGSLLAPLMNSSRDSLPAGQTPEKNRSYFVGLKQRTLPLLKVVNISIWCQ